VVPSFGSARGKKLRRMTRHAAPLPRSPVGSGMTDMLLVPGSVVVLLHSSG
jgi:hypothetical protein